jgi:hypothetical protein
MPEIELEEEEFTSPLTAPIFKRIVGMLKPHKKWIYGFWAAIAVTSLLDGAFTFINKNMIDQGIALGDREVIFRHSG